MTSIPIEKQIAEARKELRRRQINYPKRVRAEVMTEEEKQEGLDNMQAIIVTLEGLALQEKANEQQSGQNPHQYSMF